MNLDLMTQAQRIEYAESNLAGFDTITKVLANKQYLTGYPREVTVSSTYFTGTTFDPAVQYLSIYVNVDMRFIWDATSDSDADLKLSSGNTSHFLAAGERITFGLIDSNINRVDFVTSGSGISTGHALITAFTQKENIF